MITALLTDPNGKTFIAIGLSFENLRWLRAEPLDVHIRIEGASLGLSRDIVITAGETEDAIVDALRRG